MTFKPINKKNVTLLRKDPKPDDQKWVPQQLKRTLQQMHSQEQKMLRQNQQKKKSNTPAPWAYILKYPFFIELSYVLLLKFIILNT